jgi:hypothetical protein
MKGILMRPDNIQAIIEGRKTQTRRLIKHTRQLDYMGMTKDEAHSQISLARYQQGETVYIKEAWAVPIGWDNVSIKVLPHDLPVWYKDGTGARITGRIGRVGKWRSPLFMPEWAARHFIVIESVRAERVQEIKDDEFGLEGIEGGRPEAIMCSEFIALWNSINKDYPWESNPFVFVYTFRLKGGENA